MHRQFERAKEVNKYQVLPQDDPGERLLGNEGTDDTESCAYPRQMCRCCPDVEGDNFNISIGFVIVINAVVLGLETDLGQEKFLPFEHCFAAVFTLEMFMRLCQLGFCGYFSTLSNAFDCLLVCTGDFDLWISPFVIGTDRGQPKAQSSGARIMKLLRMFRVMRIVRLFKMFRQLQIILEAFVKALSTVLWVGLLTLIFNYVCAVFLTQTIGHSANMWDEDSRDDVYRWFGTIGHSLRTLFIILTLAQWDEIALVLSERVSGVVVFATAIGYITITAFTMVSLITGIISEELVGSRKDDEEFKLSRIERGKRELVANVRTLLVRCDEDGGGTLSGEEIQQALNCPKLKLISKLQSFEIAMEMDDFLALIDKLKTACGSEEVPIDDVANALEHLSGSASSSSVWDLKMLTMAGQKQASSDTDKNSQAIQKLQEQVQLGSVQTGDKFDNLVRRLEQAERNLDSESSQISDEIDEIKLNGVQTDDQVEKLMGLTTQFLEQQAKLQFDNSQANNKLGNLLDLAIQLMDQQSKLQDDHSQAKDNLDKFIARTTQLMDQQIMLQVDKAPADDNLGQPIDLTLKSHQQANLQDDSSQTTIDTAPGSA